MVGLRGLLQSCLFVLYKQLDRARITMPCALPALPAAVSVLVSEPGVAADSYISVFGINPSSGDTRETRTNDYHLARLYVSLAVGLVTINFLWALSCLD